MECAVFRLNCSFSKVACVGALCSVSRFSFSWCDMHNEYVIRGTKTTKYAFHISCLFRLLVRILQAYYFDFVVNVCSAVLICRDGAILFPNVLCAVS